MRFTLDPKVDIVFKMFFSDPRNQHVLASLLNAVLKPASRITEVTVLNPELPQESIDHKQIVLDVRARCSDGRYYNAEMQLKALAGRRERSLYYLTRMYGTQLRSAEPYTDLAPCRAIWITAYNELETARFHSTFRLLEVHEHEEFSGHLELHLVELPKLASAIARGDEPELANWGRFFAAESDEELEDLAVNNPEMQAAKEALDRLSADPKARALAEERREALFFYERELELARKQAAAEAAVEADKNGEERGLRKGEERGLKMAIETLCRVLSLPLTEERQRTLLAADGERLAQLLEHLETHRAWPEP